MKPLLLLDAYLDPRGGSASFLPRFQARPVLVLRPAHGHALPDDPRAFAGIVMNGSAASWADGVPWGEPVLALLQRCADAGVPYLGVCFGHQALGAAFGAGVRKAATPEVGWKDVVVHDAADPLLGAHAPGFVQFLSHEDEVVPTDVGLDRLASTTLCPMAAVKVRGAPMWGVQFHAELGLDEARQLLAYRARRHPELGLDVEAEAARAAHATDLADDLIARFLERLPG